MDDFAAVFGQGAFTLELKASTKDEIIEEMVDMLVDDGHLTQENRAPVLAAVLERESKLSTGIQDGVAIPHGKTDRLDKMVTAFGMKHDGVDFDSLDGVPSKIFIMTVSEINRTGPHIQYMAAISRLLSREAIRETLLQAETREEVLEVFSD